MVYIKTANGWSRCLPGSIIYELTNQEVVERVILCGLIKNAPASAPQGGATRRQVYAS